jgi:heptosyltransferase II
MKKILVIQTAFIGDVVLATAMVEKLAACIDAVQIDFLVRGGNETLLNNNPHINKVLVWQKKENKFKNLFAIINTVRKNKYDIVINLQRYFSTGLITILSAAKQTRGFDKNPLSFLFTKKYTHQISTAKPFKHEVERNNDLIADITNTNFCNPKLYPSNTDFEKVKPYLLQSYITISPTSVWFTKQFPFEKWVTFIDVLPKNLTVYLLGGKDNTTACEKILSASVNKNITILAGELNFLQSAALMKTAKMNYVNDSAPLHFASAVDAPVTAIFCSTIPGFGFTPLSTVSNIIEHVEGLPCRPCGLHGKKNCPLGHFKCATEIEVSQLLNVLN